MELYRVQAGQLVYAYRGKYYPATDKLTLRKVELMADLTRHCNAALSGGYIYRFPDGLMGTIQTRDALDAANLSRIVTTALVLKSKNSKAVFTEFRDLENVFHQLTPDQAIDMHLALHEYTTSQLQLKWQREAAVWATTNFEALVYLPVETGWGQQAL
jgi:hypothetical protein